MKLRIKQNFFSMSDSFNIFDENMNVKYIAKSNFFSFGYMMKIYTANNKELAYIKQKMFSLLPEFQVYIKGEYRGCIKKRFTLFNDKYELEYREWHVVGDFLGWDYDIFSHCSAEVHIRKEIFNLTDTYTIEIDYPEDEIDALMVVLAIDMANRSK